MRILIVSDAWHPQVNGVVRTYELIIGELKARGHAVRVIGPGDFVRSISMPGYPEIRLALFPYRPLRRMIDAYAPDSIHIATEGPLGWAARRYCKEKGIPFSTSYHTQYPDYIAERVGQYLKFLQEPARFLSKALIRLFHKPSHLILVATTGLKNILQDWNFENKMHIFSRGVDTDLFYPGSKKLFNDLAGPVALYVGRIAIEKNLKAFLDMEWAGSKVVVGQGPLMEDFVQRYPDVRFTGKKTGQELADHYRSADLFVFPSRTDTFGMVIVEALACGLPVAAFNVTGPKDIITDSSLGALEDNNLSQAATRAFAVGTPEERAAHVKNHYTWTRAAQQFEEGLLQVMISK
ncbi:MAG: glycosyltransferase family 4 protein [Alphaproteobacteria bacterium]